MKSQKKITALIVDDEELARGLVREYLSAYPEIEIIGECGNGFDAVKIITEQHPSLLFLDIQMPKLNGFEVLELLEDPPAIIFVTAYDQYALKAFDVHAVDYLLKPFGKDRFADALERAKKNIEKNTSSKTKQIIDKARPKDQMLERVLIKEGSKVLIIPIDTIDYVEAQDDYVNFRVSGKSHLKQHRLAELEVCLDPKRFVRIHRSYILNIERLAKIELYAKDSRVALLKDGTKIPISRT